MLVTMQPLTIFIFGIIMGAIGMFILMLVVASRLDKKQSHQKDVLKDDLVRELWHDYLDKMNEPKK